MFFFFLPRWLVINLFCFGQSVKHSSLTSYWCFPVTSLSNVDWPRCIVGKQEGYEQQMELQHGCILKASQLENYASIFRHPIFGSAMMHMSSIICFLFFQKNGI